jgi:hypothetical protein
MRLFFGIILGAALTVGAAYVCDSTVMSRSPAGATSAQRPMVNWDVVAENWRILRDRAHEGWIRLSKLASG